MAELLQEREREYMGRTLEKGRNGGKREYGSWKGKTEGKDAERFKGRISV